MQEFSNTHLWASRGYLPHYHASHKYQMITYRLADSLPQKILKELKEDYKNPALEKEHRKYIEKVLDSGYGSCILQKPEVSQIVVDNWRFFHKKRYDLIAFVVMPNHVHLIIKTYENFSLSTIVHGWKSFTANKISKSLAGWQPAFPGKVWQCDYWDRFIRDENHFEKAVQYIHNNPLKAGLIDSPEKWQWSSTYQEK